MLSDQGCKPVNTHPFVSDWLTASTPLLPMPPPHPHICPPPPLSCTALIVLPCPYCLPACPQVILLGSAPDPAVQKQFEAMAVQLGAGSSARLVLRHDEALSHRIYAGGGRGEGRGEGGRKGGEAAPPHPTPPHPTPPHPTPPHPPHPTPPHPTPPHHDVITPHSIVITPHSNVITPHPSPP